MRESGPLPNEHPDPKLLLDALALADPGLLSQVDRFHQNAARLRELDLTAAEPVLVYRPRGGA